MSLKRLKLRLSYISERIRLEATSHRLVVTRPKLSAMSNEIGIRPRFRGSYLYFCNSRPNHSHRWPLLLG